MNALIASLGGSNNALLYAGFDIYIRPITAADATTYPSAGISGTALTNYTLSAAGSPIPAGADSWSTTVGTFANGGLDTNGLSNRYFATPANATFALVTYNQNVTGQTYSPNPETGSGSITGEMMPNSDRFGLTLTSTDSNASKPVNFLMFITALQFTSSSASSLTTQKTATLGPIEFQMTATPEPASLGFALGGLILMAGGYIRRQKESR